MTIWDSTAKAPAQTMFGPRPVSDIRGALFHMAEGLNVSGYLSRAPARNVSVQYTIEQKDAAGHFDGEIVRMVPERIIAGSLNPAALRAGDDAYYGRSHLDYVLGSLATNANRGVIAVEMAGTHAKGPTPAQVASAVRLFRDLLKRYPNIKPLGHRDQQDVKPCPGNTVAIRRMFTLMGGHGKDYRKERPDMSTVGYVPNQVATIKVGAALREYPGAVPFGAVADPLTRPTFGTTPDGKYRLVAADDPADLDARLDRTAWVVSSSVTALATLPTDQAAIDAAARAARAKALADAEAAVQALR